MSALSLSGSTLQWDKRGRQL